MARRRKVAAAAAAAFCLCALPACMGLHARPLVHLPPRRAPIHSTSSPPRRLPPWAKALFPARCFEYGASACSHITSLLPFYLIWALQPPFWGLRLTSMGTILLPTSAT